MAALLPGNLHTLSSPCERHQAQRSSAPPLRKNMLAWRSLARSPCRKLAACIAPPDNLSRMGTWSGYGTQEDLMIRDTCILVDENDEILGHGSKRDCHKFSKGQNGILHRAFSVFLFNSENKLLLQQRASSKITFPDVWTNTCCSHPLHGFTPSEVDTAASISSGDVPGAKHAAMRKLEHELGIPKEQVPFEHFKYLTRLHYCAADLSPDGEPGEWGEHEMDYLLFIRSDVNVDPNPEEVRDYRYVTPDELEEMMAPESGLKWSPWFRIISKNFLRTWWDNLPKVLSTDEYVDTKTIHRLDCVIDE